MKQLLLILLALTCVLFSAPAGSNGADEETTEQPSIESSGSKNGDDEEERTEDLQKKTSGATSQPETMSSANFYGTTAILRNILKTISEAIYKAISKTILTDILRDFDNPYGESVIPLSLAVLAVSLALTTHQAILGFLQMPKLVLLISTCLILFAGRFIWSSGVEDKWMFLLEILIPLVFISGMLVYCYRYLLPKLAIGLFVLVVSVTLPIFLGVANEETYDIGIAEFCGIGGGAWLVYINHNQLIPSWTKFRNRLSRRKGGKDENERENKKNEG